MLPRQGDPTMNDTDSVRLIFLLFEKHKQGPCRRVSAVVFSKSGIATREDPGSARRNLPRKFRGMNRPA
jgi:hypothetical protein